MSTWLLPTGAIRNCDDGIGFPAGVDFRQPETLGLQLVGALTEQLRGTVSLVSGDGGEFVVIFPS
jgi:two-component sensor histidine kinase